MIRSNVRKPAYSGESAESADNTIAMTITKGPQHNRCGKAIALLIPRAASMIGIFRAIPVNAKTAINSPCG
ncbi:hypothetical protein NBRC116589_00030 [Ruegeria sp. HU-ET01832]